MLPSTAMTTEAASDLDYMLTISENAKTYIKSKIDKMDNSDSRILICMVKALLRSINYQ